MIKRAETSRPIIGLNLDDFADAGGAITGLRPNYIRAIERAGAIPLLLPHIEDPAALRDAIARVDGFLLTGGDDVSPERSGCGPVPTVVTMAPERERSDFALIDALLDSRKPTLCVCLGFQELNIRFGGTLYQDLAFDAPPSAVRHYAKLADPPTHAVEVDPGSALAAALGASGRVTVNSKHHQGVNKLGAGLKISARAPDGLVEGLEVEGLPFFVAVQWHPEAMPDSPEQARLFAALAAASRR